MIPTVAIAAGRFVVDGSHGSGYIRICRTIVGSWRLDDNLVACVAFCGRPR